MHDKIRYSKNADFDISGLPHYRPGRIVAKLKNLFLRFRAVLLHVFFQPFSHLLGKKNESLLLSALGALDLFTNERYQPHVWG